MINIILITDTWDPQINGVVSTYKNIIKHLPIGYNIDVVEPGIFRKIPEIPKSSLNILSIDGNDDSDFLEDWQRKKMYEIAFRLGIPVKCNLSQMLFVLEQKTHFYQSQDQAVFYHLANEGSLGLQAKRILDRNSKRYTSSYHTKFPEFFYENFNIPVEETKWYFDWFHKKSKTVFSSSYSSSIENISWNSVPIEVGINDEFTFIDKKTEVCKTLLFAGRVSKEKNIDDFCNISIPHTKKVVVGDGPDLQRLKRQFPDIDFLGFKQGKDLAEIYHQSDVLVFPSKVDTYGMVILEANACGTPVAAYDVTGAKDQIKEGINGCLDTVLSNAVERCFLLDRKQVYSAVSHKTWSKAAKIFVDIVTKP